MATQKKKVMPSQVRLQERMPEKKAQHKKHSRRPPGGRTSSSQIPRVSSNTPVHAYIRQLKSSCSLMETKKKPSSAGQRVSDVVYTTDPETTSLASAFVSMGTVYTFRLAGHISTIISNSSGVIDTHIPFDPSASGVNFPEWSALSSLFSEFRLKEFGCQLVSSQVTLFPAGNPSALLVASNLGTAVNPGSYAAVADNADSRQWSVTADTTGHGYFHHVRNTGLGWSQVTTPTTEPFAGVPGSIQMYMDSGATWGSVGTIVVSALVWGIYEFRSRV